MPKFVGKLKAYLSVDLNSFQNYVFYILNQRYCLDRIEFFDQPECMNRKLKQTLINRVKILLSDTEINLKKCMFQKLCQKLDFQICLVLCLFCHTNHLIMKLCPYIF